MGYGQRMRYVMDCAAEKGKCILKNLNFRGFSRFYPVAVPVCL